MRHELLRALHPPAGRHHAAGDRPVAGRASSPTASCRSRACRRSTSRPSASPPAGRAPIPRPWRRRVAAPLERRLGEIAGVTELTSRSSLGIDPHLDPVRSQPQHRRRRARRAGRPQRRADRPAGRPAVAAVVPQVQSGGDADHDPGAHLEHHAAERDLRRRRHRDRAAPVAGRRRRRGDRQRRRAAGDPRARQSGRARLDGAVAWRTCAPRSPTPTPPARSASSTATSAPITHRDQRPAAHRAANTTRSWCEAANGTVVRLSAVASIEQGVRNSRSAGWFNGQPSVLLVITKQADANVIETVDRIHELLPELKRWIPAGIDISVLSDRTSTIRASVSDMQLTLLATDRAGHAGGVPVPAARGRRRSPPASPCRCRSPAPAR